MTDLVKENNKTFMQYFRKVKGVYSQADVEKIVADERQKILSEVEEIIGEDEEVSPIRLTAEAAEIAGKVQSAAEGRNQYRAELRAKLAEMKEGK